MSDQAVNRQCIIYDGWIIQAIFYNNIGPHEPPPNHINIYEITPKRKHIIEKEAIRQASNIWLNSFQDIDLQEYLNGVFSRI